MERRQRAVFKGGNPSLKYGPVPSLDSFLPLPREAVYGSNPYPKLWGNFYGSMDQSFSQSFHCNPWKPTVMNSVSYSAESLSERFAYWLSGCSDAGRRNAAEPGKYFWVDTDTDTEAFRQISSYYKQESCAIAKMTARCALYK